MSLKRLRTEEDGAVAIVFVLLLVPLLAIAALVVDVGGGYVQKRKLQNATDAVAMAIAQDCAGGVCGNTALTAQTLVTANAGAATAVVTITGSSVTVRGAAAVNYRFAPAMGIRSSSVHTTSSARWGAPSGATSVLPLMFSWCSFAAQTGGGVPTGTTAVTINFAKTDGTTDCTGPSGNPVPGGFAWIQTLPGTCTAKTATGVAQTFSDPGNSVPNSCSTNDIGASQNQTVLLPIFDKFGGTGGGAWYHAYAYAAFRLTGYYFGGQYKWNNPCSGNARCIRGYFTKMVDISEGATFSTTAPNLGSSIIALTA
jgi:Flp pilus assembly protein TadG